MGVSLKGLYEGQSLKIDTLSRKVVAVDAYNILYQFLTTIRGYDGGQLMNSKGMVTSHIQGLFSRVAALMQFDIKLVFVFDGKPPKLKQGTLDGRRGRKDEAAQKYAAALAAEDIKGMSTYARQTTVLTKEMAQQAQDLLKLMGIPVIVAPSEGEAQAAHMCKQGDVDFVASQDADALLFGAPVIVRNLSITGRRKLPGKSQWVVVEPKKIVLQDVLNDLKINQQQLLWLAMLVGTDYAPGGVKGIGPKNAIKLVKEFNDKPDELFQKVEWDTHQSVPWQEILEVFTHMPITNDYILEWIEPDYEAIQELMESTYEFSADRIAKTLNDLKKHRTSSQQQGLGDFF